MTSVGEKASFIIPFREPGFVKNAFTLKDTRPKSEKDIGKAVR